MGILEKERVLYFLILFCGIPGLGFAEQTNYFASKVDFFDEKVDCPSCQAKEEMQKQVAKTTAAIQVPAGLTAAAEKEVTLFIDPNCQYCPGAIKTLEGFVQKHPEFTVKVFVNGSLNDFQPIGQALTRQHPQWAIVNDLTGGKAKDLGITRVPAFIMAVKGRSFRFYGGQNLEEVEAIYAKNQ